MIPTANQLFVSCPAETASGKTVFGPEQVLEMVGDTRRYSRAGSSLVCCLLAAVQGRANFLEERTSGEWFFQKRLFRH